MGQEQSTIDLEGFAYEDPSLYPNGPIPLNSVQQSNSNPPTESPPAPPEEVIDIYDTGVSEGLRALLATLHEDESLISTESSTLPPSTYYDTKLSSAAAEFVPSTASGLPLRWNAAAPAFVPSFAAAPVPAVAPATMEMRTWWYKDPKGVSRGPFSTLEMKSWFDQGYFKNELMVAREEHGPYISLAQLFGTGDSLASSFATYMEVRDFNITLANIFASSNR